MPSAEVPFDRGTRGGQRLVQLRRVLAACLRHVVATAAPAADDRRDLADDRAGGKAALDRVFGDERDEACFAAELASDHYNRRLIDLRLHPVSEIEELLRE